MKILQIGKNKIITNNLISLGAEVGMSRFIPYNDKAYDGIVITKDLPFWSMDELKAFKIPIITNYLSKNIDALVIDEEKTKKLFPNPDKSKELITYKNTLKQLGIKYLVITFGKERIENYIKQNLPIIQTTMNVTKETVDKAKDVVTAVITYTYIKTGKLIPESIKQANTNAIVTDLKGFKNIGDYYLQIKRQK